MNHRTYLTNCILTPNHGPQAFLDLHVPLEAGEDVCRAFFVAVLTALLAGQGEGSDAKLVKVSMCASIPEGMKSEEMDTKPELAWFNEGNGKLYFN